MGELNNKIRLHQSRVAFLWLPVRYKGVICFVFMTLFVLWLNLKLPTVVLTVRWNWQKLHLPHKKCFFGYNMQITLLYPTATTHTSTALLCNGGIECCHWRSRAEKIFTRTQVPSLSSPLYPILMCIIFRVIKHTHSGSPYEGNLFWTHFHGHVVKPRPVGESYIVCYWSKPATESYIHCDAFTHVQTY